jgi:hypothetical protein
VAGVRGACLSISLSLAFVVAHDWRHEQHEHEGIFVLCQVSAFELGLGFDLTYVMTS